MGLVALALAAAGALFAVAARASRGARMVVDDRGLTWDAGAATWHASWDELTEVGLSVLRSGTRPGPTQGRGSDRIVWIGMAFDREEPDADRPPLRRLRTVDEPPPFTHRMSFAARPGWAGRLEDGLRAFGGRRFAGTTVRDARGRAVEG